jgi:hypothetical protein
MPRLLYVKAPAPDREPKLTELLGRIQSDDTASYKPFQTPEELARLVSADLALLLSERFMSIATMSEDQPPDALSRAQHNLPVQLSSLVGRDAELATVKRARDDHHDGVPDGLESALDSDRAEADEHHWAVEGMLTPEEMQELMAVDGPIGQQLFLEGMIEHHKGAITMVQENR